ncbi:MAG: FkbM family methyltransferase [Prolixibacteraceae bacterium]|nr:FkbM family methyltransferase [Prolixibacteraceae bacterium]
MHGFIHLPDHQYFEDFLHLKSAGEIFIDVGCYDGFTALEFIKRYPDYEAIHVFEPEPMNMAYVKKCLQEYPRIFYHDIGLSNQAQILRFKSQGSSSCATNDGDILIKVDRLDDILTSPITYIKMDIEGGEIMALEGAKQSIVKYHPHLAISVYHRVDDLWHIPQLILSFWDDYRIFLRHYTEGVTETVMYFVPVK